MKMLSILTILAAVASSAVAADATIDYRTQIAPVFNKYCNGCHNATDREGKLALDAYASLLKGGEHGPVVVAGSSAKSKLVQVLTGQAKPAMPPDDNEKPSAADIALLAKWIDAGAHGPVGDADPVALVTPKVPVKVAAKDPVSAIAFFPDGAYVAVARYGGVDRVAVADRSVVGRIRGHQGRVNGLSFSQDGKQLVTAAGEPGLFGEAKLWDAATGALLQTFRGHADSLYSAVLSPDGKLLATSSYDQQIKLWDVATGKEVRTLSGHNDAVFDLSFRPDGKILASASGDRTVKLWKVATGERLDTLGQSLKDLYAVAFSPDGQRVAAGGIDNRIRIWQVTPDAKENSNPLLLSKFAHEGAIIKLLFSRDGKTLVSASDDRTIKIWTGDTVSEQRALERQPDWTPALALSPDGKTLVAGRADGSLAVYDVATGKATEPAMAAKPELAGVSARGWQRGTSGSLKLLGKNLNSVQAVKSSHPKITAALASSAGWNQAGEVDADLSVAADVPPGAYELWVVSAAGESGKVSLLVDTLPQLGETEPNDVRTAAQSLNVGSSMWGVLSQKGDVDSYRFHAAKGQTIVLEVAAASAGSKLNAILTLFDSQGRVVAGNNDFDNQSDPVVAYSIPADDDYVVQISDLALAGSSDNYYRLTVSTQPYVTAVFPTYVAPQRATQVELAGLNVPAGAKVAIPAAVSGEITAPLDANQYRSRKPLKVMVGGANESNETEPNGAPDQANRLTIPGSVNGRIWSQQRGSDDQDLFRFSAKAGQTWIIETEAARRGSPVDTALEVLHTDGRPVQRLLLEANRDSQVTFRPIDSNIRDVRVSNWQEMELNEYLYMNGEICKIFRLPQGPDSGFQFYEGDGAKRRCYFETSPTVHALDEACYIVSPLPPGSKPSTSGLPVFMLNYANDDDGERKLGSDSRVTFVAPQDGDYLIRVRDTRGASGDRFLYRLTVREPRPDFNVTLTGVNPAVEPGSGKPFTVSADRIDGFDGDIKVEITGLPPGFHVNSPILIQSGHRDAKGVLYADAGAAAPTAANAGLSVVKASAALAGKVVTKDVNNLGAVKLGAKPKLIVRLEPAEITIAPGQMVTATLKVERHGHEDLVNFTVEGLPHGVFVENLGLNGVLLPKGQTERQIFLSAVSWVTDTDRTCFGLATNAGVQASTPVLLKVRKPSPLADASKKKE